VAIQMPETPEKLFERAAGSLRTPPVHEWETFPFAGRLEPRPLEPPLPSEPPREGEGSIDCSSCARSDDGYIWTDANWRLIPYPEPGGLPLVLLLESREQFAEPGDLPIGLAGELGVLQAKIDHAMRTIDGFGRVHICRWGDGAEHLHWWFLARPARLPQLLGSFAAIWDDVLPPTPAEIWQENIERFLTAFRS
jgi:hypothetical protein